MAAGRNRKAQIFYQWLLIVIFQFINSDSIEINNRMFENDGMNYD